MKKENINSKTQGQITCFYFLAAAETLARLKITKRLNRSPYANNRWPKKKTFFSCVCGVTVGRPSKIREYVGHRLS